VSRLEDPRRWKPEGYRPGLRLSLREELEGGPLRDPAEIEPPLDPRRECLVLVHGFNNHAGEAALAYFQFRRDQYALDALITPPALERLFADAYWPGDADWRGPLDRFDFLVYPIAVRTAKEAGRVLGNAILRLPNLVAVDLIGHSLGCRLILEAVAHLLRTGGPHVRRLCLMAAAVPVEMLEDGGRFEDLMRNLAAGGTQVHVMFSSSDTVLRYTFPPGQAAAGEPSLRALGLVGPPPDLSAPGGLVTRQSIDGARHSHYWGDPDPGRRAQAAREAGRFLEIAETGRTLGARQAGRVRALGAVRAVGSPDGML
jgi:hypothetical protein